MNKLTKWILSIASIAVLSVIGFVWHKDANTQVNLNGEKHIVLDYGETYEDEGMTVSYRDKDLEQLDAINHDFDADTLGTYTFNYEYQWLFKTHNLKRTVEIVDEKPPVLKLKGEKEMTLEIDDAFEEPGFEASDDYDGDLLEAVEVKGDVDTQKEGSYELIYRVEDTSGNSAEAKRKVKVKKPKPKPKPVTPSAPSNTNSTPGVIYLTFDDGPHPTRTDAILDILKEEGIQATFFVTGRGPDAPIKRIVDEGHTIALHTDTHVYSDVYASVDNYYRDLNNVSNRVENITGIKSKFIRFPGGSSNTISRQYQPGIMSHLVEDVVEKGYIYHDWNVDSLDASQNISAQTVFQNTVNGLSKNYPNIVLMHDVHQHTVDALRDVIRFGKENGYTFEKITDSTRPVHHGVNN